MVVVRDIEPWDALLEAGRDDERLVMQASQDPRPPQEVAVPEELHPDVAEALGKRGSTACGPTRPRLLHSAWAGPIVTTGTASGKSLCFNLPAARRPVPRRAGARCTCTRQGAGAGSGAGAERARSGAGGRRSTTATRRASSARRSGAAPTSSSPTPTCCTSGSSPTTRRGATSSPTWRWSSTSASTAACSARTSPTC